MTDAERAILVDYVDLFATPVGQRVLEDMKRRAGFYGTKVRRGFPIDQTRLVWCEAQRAFAIEIANRAAWDFAKEPAPEKETEDA